MPKATSFCCFAGSWFGFLRLFGDQSFVVVVTTEVLSLMYADEPPVQKRRYHVDLWPEKVIKVIYENLVLSSND